MGHEKYFIYEKYKIAYIVLILILEPVLYSVNAHLGVTLKNICAALKVY